MINPIMDYQEKLNLSMKCCLSGTYPALYGDWYSGLGVQITLFKFRFFMYFNKAVNDFTIHLIILKWFRRQKCRLKRKTMRQRDVKVKQKIVYKNVFIYLKCNRSWKCSLFLLDFFTNLLQVLNDAYNLHYFVWCLLYYLLHLYNSDHLAALTRF